jgi:hypothetical protein
MAVGGGTALFDRETVIAHDDDALIAAADLQGFSCGNGATFPMFLKSSITACLPWSSPLVGAPSGFVTLNTTSLVR